MHGLLMNLGIWGSGWGGINYIVDTKPGGSTSFIIRGGRLDRAWTFRLQRPPVTLHN